MILGKVLRFEVHELDVWVEGLVTGSLETALVLELSLVLFGLDYQCGNVGELRVLS